MCIQSIGQVSLFQLPELYVQVPHRKEDQEGSGPAGSVPGTEPDGELEDEHIGSLTDALYTVKAFLEKIEKEQGAPVRKTWYLAGYPMYTVPFRTNSVRKHSRPADRMFWPTPRPLSSGPAAWHASCISTMCANTYMRVASPLGMLLALAHTMPTPATLDPLGLLTGGLAP